MGSGGQSLAVGRRQPRFDPSPAPVVPLRRIDSRCLRAPAVSGGSHPALPSEGVATAEAHALEMRVFWGEGLLNIHHFIGARRITIGETRRATVFISSEGLPADEFPLIRFFDERYVLTVTAAMEGEVELDGVVTPLAETRLAPGASIDDDLDGAWFVPLTICHRAIVHWGGATFALRFVPPPRRLPNPLLKRLEPPYLNMLLLSLFFHLTLIVTLMVHPGEVQATTPHRFFDAVVELYPDVVSPHTRPAPVPPREEPPHEGGRQAAAPAAKGKGVRRSAKRADKASVQRSLGRMLGSGSRLLGPGGGTLFGHIANAIGTHGRDRIPVGLRGFGTRGGPALGVFGELRHAGPIETGLVGRGSDPGLGDRPESGILTVERPDVRDPLARDMIHKVVQQNRRQIRFCYEWVLHREHDLEGKVAVSWVIGATGEVAEVLIVESTLDNREVERCMIEKIRRWRFPAPAGGGTVRVNYPFVFHAT